LRAQAETLDAAQRQEVAAAKRRLRVGFQIALLAAIALAMFALVFPTLRLYMAQQAHKEQLQSQVDQAKRQNEDLEAELKRWEDPAYVKAQARERLSFALPGDRTFRVSDPENAPAPEVAAVPSPPSTHLLPQQPETLDQEDPWYVKLWNSTAVAGQVK
jgi:cell division protein FtsB